MEEEIFKDIPWYEWYYQVSNIWRVKKLDRNEKFKTRWWNTTERFRKWWFIYVTKQKKNIRWQYYKLVCLWKKWKVKSVWLHRLVAMCFLENKWNKLCVNHLDWNPENNNMDNLEWCTHSENELHSFRILWKKVWNKWLKKSSLTTKKLDEFRETP